MPLIPVIFLMGIIFRKEGAAAIPHTLIWLVGSILIHPVLKHTSKEPPFEFHR